MSEINPVSAERVPDELVDALDVALLAGSKIFGVPRPVHYALEMTEDESAVKFPAEIEHISRHDAKIKVHITSLIDQYGCDGVLFSDEKSGLSLADAAKIHIAASVIPHMLICAVNPRDTQIITRLGGYMSHPDTLTNDIANSIMTLGMFEARLREAVLSKGPDEIAEINRYRLALGALGYLESDAGNEEYQNRQHVDFSQRISMLFLERLKEIPYEIKKLINVAKMFNLDEHTAESNFMDEISQIEFAAAFPMQLPEISLLAQIVNGTRV